MIKVEVTKTKVVKEVIEVELPYYYKRYLSSDFSNTIIFGKITQGVEFTINEVHHSDGEETYEISRGSMSTCFYSEDYKSTAKEFEDARDRASSFLNKYFYNE